MVDAMDKENLVMVPKKITETYVYKHNIEKVWELFKDINRFPEFHNNAKTHIKFLKGNNSYEVGNIFVMKFAFIDVVYEVVNVTNQEEFKQFQWKCCKSVPTNVNYDYKIYLYRTTADDSTLLNLELDFEKEWYLTHDQKEEIDRERRRYLVNVDKYLSKCVKEQYQYESIIIKTSREKLWGIVTNWVEFRALVPLISDDVIYDGDPLVKDTKLTLKWLKKGAECHLRVKIVSCNDNDDIWTYMMECYDGSPKPPPQNIVFIISKMSEEDVFLEFKHEFLETINQGIMQSMSQDKQKILLELRKQLEKDKE